MIHYTEYANKTPTELINEAQEEIQAGKLMIQRRIFFTLPRFRQYLEKAISPQSNRFFAPDTLEKYINFFTNISISMFRGNHAQKSRENL